MFRLVTAAWIALVLAPVSGLWAQDYVGPGKCKICHKKEEMGNQYGVWEKEKHSKAYQNLGTPEAKEAGAKLGVTDPQNDPKCLICHTTAYDKPNKKGVELSDGVSCEECHGPGSKFKPKDVHGESYEKGLAAGMAPFKTEAEQEAICKRCHTEERDGNKNPSYKPFDLKERLEKIKHPLKKKE